MSLAVLPSVPPDIFIVKGKADVFFTEAIRGYTLPHAISWKNGIVTFTCQDKDLAKTVSDKLVAHQNSRF